MNNLSPNNSSNNTELLNHIRSLLVQAQQQVATTVNTVMVQTYWQIGRLIVEDEQQGQVRAEYGKGVLKNLSISLTAEFGKGFSLRNLRNMQKLYLSFPIRQTLSAE